MGLIDRIHKEMIKRYLGEPLLKLSIEILRLSLLEKEQLKIAKPSISNL